MTGKSRRLFSGTYGSSLGIPSMALQVQFTMAAISKIPRFTYAILISIFSGCDYENAC